MRKGFKKNDIAIAVETLPKHKLPCLTVYPDSNDMGSVVKVATFKDEAEAEWFYEMMAEMLGVKI